MKVEVLLFAQLKEMFGKDRLFFDVEEGARVETVVERLMGESSLPRWRDFPLLYAVNENFVSEKAVLRERDTLALMMPVSGGST